MNLRAITAAIVCLAWLYIAFNVVPVETVRAWPDWAGGLFVLSLLASALGLPVFGLYGLGVLGTGALPARDGERSLTVEQWIATYLCLLLGLAAIVALLAMAFRMNYLRACFLSCGAVFIFASTPRPWWLFATVRRTGWFALIQSDLTMRWLLRGLGTALFLVGALGTFPSGTP